MNRPERTKEYRGPVGLRQAPVVVEDLDGEWTLDGCPRLDFRGAERPALGGYALVAKLGRGGMGYVFRGVRPETGEEVAVKVLPRALQEGHQQALARFLREGRLAAALDHENLVRVREVGEHEPTGTYFLIMDCVNGVTAGQWVKELVDGEAPGAPERDAVAVMRAACAGLAAAHEAEIIHRDIKPDNILLPVPGDGPPAFDRAKVTDLGLARLVEDPDGLTKTSVGLGTAGVMAPEQLEDAKRATKAADVFSMGATLYALLTGTAPFEGSSSVMTIMNTMKGEFPPLTERRPDASPGVAAVIERCLARDPAARYPDAAALRDALAGV